MALVRSSLVNRLPNIRGLSGLVVLSAVLHGGLLLLPLPQWWSADSEPDEVIEESGAIAITTLPVITKPEPKTIAPVEPVSPPAVLPPAPLTQVPEALPEDTLEELESIDVPADIPPENTEVPVENDNQLPLDRQNSDDPEAGVAIPFSDDFPHIMGATSGCYGLEHCRTVAGQSFNNVARQIRQDLENKGYELTPYDNDDGDGANHDIYEMRLLASPEADVQYLNIFGEGFAEAFYIITLKIITREELETLDINNLTSG